jgi:hypothetical protein
MALKEIVTATSVTDYQMKVLKLKPREEFAAVYNSDLLHLS